MGYVRVPIETNPETIFQDMVAYVQSVFPNYVPNDGNLDTAILRAFAFKCAENRDLASDVPDSIFMYLGSSLFSIPPDDAVAATSTTTWTLIDNLGHTIPAGTVIGIKDANGDLFTFATVADVIVAPGSLVTAAGEVVIRATQIGIASNNLNAVPELVDVYDWVSSIALVAPTSGGLDAETVDDYLNRLVSRFQLLTRTPILAPDFALAALDADPSVYRAVALDGYDPVANTFGHARTVTIAGLDIAGNNVSAGVKTNIANYIATLREVNFVINTMDPHRTQIDVAASIKVLPGFDGTLVEADVIAAIDNYLNPAMWGVDPEVTGTQQLRTWIELEKVYYNELIALVSSVQGVDRVTDLTTNVHGSAVTRADVALTAPASVTTIGTITCVVV